MNGRGVVITGLPYPPRMDPKVAYCVQSQVISSCECIRVGYPEDTASEGHQSFKCEGRG